jgi:hypothetical protein
MQQSQYNQFDPQNQMPPNQMPPSQMSQQNTGGMHQTFSGPGQQRMPMDQQRPNFPQQIQYILVCVIFNFYF